MLPLYLPPGTAVARVPERGKGRGQRHRHVQGRRRPPPRHDGASAATSDG